MKEEKNELLEISESPPVHFEKVKSYFKDRTNVRKISTIGFTIDKDEVFKAINEFNGRPNVYAILIKKPSDSLWDIKYIGQRKSNGIRQRLREHFIMCNARTGSQLKRVKSALLDGYEIGIKLVAILPDTGGQEHLRLVYESMLIQEFKENLEWNKQK